jgi:hypothetical protein
MAVNKNVEEVEKKDGGGGGGNKTAYNINYNDNRFAQVESDKSAALKENDKMYNGMISNSDKFYQSQIDASKEYAETQKQNQQAATDFAIEKVEQQKAQAEKDYTREQAGSWADYQKQIDPYGVKAEQVAASGLSNSGYADSLQTQAYVAYQNRVATAREAYQNAVLNYNNAITEARLQNNSALAEIAYQALQKQLELSLAGFQYKNTLLLSKAETNRTIDNTYYTRYQDVLKQINTENTLKEQIRQHEATLAENKRQFDAQLAFQKEQFAYQKAKAASSGGSGGSGSIKKSSGSGSGSSSKSSSGKTTISKSEASKIDAALTGKKAPSKSQPSVDMQSVLDLGYGPISATTLDRLIKQGKVEEYTENGKLKYRKVFKR